MIVSWLIELRSGFEICFVILSSYIGRKNQLFNFPRSSAISAFHQQHMT